MAKKINYKPFQDYSQDKLTEIVTGLINWLREKEENYNIDYYLYVSNSFYKTDIEYWRVMSQEFNLMMQNAEAIELSKLKKFAASDKLNSSIVKQILINKYNWI